jgi:hypothetical protein
MSAIRWRRGPRWSSWHLLAPDSHEDTICGRIAPLRESHETALELPGNQRTCERCSVIASKGNVFAPADSPGPFEGTPV